MGISYNPRIVTEGLVLALDLSTVRDLGNCILGGGSATSNTGIFPDGPDTLTITVTNIATTGDVNVTARISWTEAQA
jgi:hypothetical protein